MHDFRAEPEGGGSDMERARQTVLFAGNTPDIRRLISSGLEDAGFQVQQADNGLDALGQISQAPPAAIICELEMSRVSGQNLIYLVRRRFPQIPFIALSKPIGPEERQTLAEMAADAVFQKAGLSVTDVCAKVSELIRTGSGKVHEPQPAKRRSERIMQRIPIEVTGADAYGRQFSERTCTIMISAFGGSISLGRDLLVEHFVSIRNLSSGIEEDFRVVRLITLVFSVHREYGVELLNPQSPIWGVQFVAPPDAEQPAALMQCSECRKVSLVSVSATHLDIFLQMGAVALHCESCDMTTRWRPAESVAEAPAGPIPSSANPGVERRKFPRHRLAMRVNVLRPGGDAAREQVLDVSKAGLCFLSTRSLDIGDVLHFSLPSTSRRERTGKIVWRHSTSLGQTYGVQYC
jgi:CheY-like chemotaxis protein